MSLAYYEGKVIHVVLVTAHSVTRLWRLTAKMSAFADLPTSIFD
jgi:hypothetical protein